MEILDYQHTPKPRQRHGNSALSLSLVALTFTGAGWFGFLCYWFLQTEFFGEVFFICLVVSVVCPFLSLATIIAVLTNVVSGVGSRRTNLLSFLIGIASIFSFFGELIFLLRR